MVYYGTVFVEVVEKSTNKLIYQATVRISGAKTGATVTDNTGSAFFVNVPVGVPYTISVSKEGYKTPDPQSGTLTYNTESQHKFFYLEPTVTPPPPQYVEIVNFKVKDPNGGGIYNAICSLDGHIARTDTYGNASIRITDVSVDKTYNWTVSAAYYNPKSGSVFLPLNTYVDVPVTLEPSQPVTPEYFLTVYLKDERGNPLPNRVVTVDTAGGMTDSDGKFTIRLKQGPYTIFVILAGYEPVVKRISLYSDTTETITLSSQYVIPPELQQLATSQGIPLTDIPPWCDDIIVVEFADELPAELNIYDVYVKIRDRVKAEYPDVLILDAKKYGNKVAIFVKGSPLIWLIIAFGVAALLVAAAISLPDIIRVWALREQAAVRAETNNAIREILSDPTLTAKQKEELIKQLIETEPKLPSSIWTQLAILIGVAAAGLVAVKLVAGRGKKEKS